MSYGGGGGGNYYGGGGGGGADWGDRKRPRDGDFGGGGGGEKRYRGGGGGGGYGGDDRRRNSWSGNERRFDKRAHQAPQPRHGQRKPKTKEDEIRSQIKALLVRVGDFHHISTSLSSLEENVEGLASALGDDLASYGDFLVDFILTAAAQLSMQTPVYATLVGLLNARDEDFGAKVVKGAAEKLDDMIRRGRWINAKLLLRFLAELVNARVVKPEGEGSLGELLTMLLAPLKKESVPTGRKDLYLYLVISVLPWAWDVLAKEWPEGLPTLLKTALTHADQRTPVYQKKGLRCVLEAGLDDEEEEEEGGGEAMEEGEDTAASVSKEPVLDSIQTAVAVVKRLAATLEEGAEPIEFNAIVKPWKSARDELAQGIKHAIPLVIVPDPDPMPENPASQPLPFSPLFAEFDIFDEGSGEKAATLASLGVMERWVLREYLKDSLVTFRPFVSEGGNKRGSFAAETDQLLSISYLAPPDVATEFLVVEALLLWLLQLPGRDMAYLQRLTMQVVQTPKAAAALALGLQIIFQDYLEVMDHVTVSQLADWFGCHLTNTQFAFPYWNVWAGLVAELQQEGGSDDHPQLYFLRRALDVASRQTYVGKVKEFLPEALHSLIPGVPYAISPYLPPAAGEEAIEGDSATTQTLKELIRRFKGVLQGESSAEEVQQWLDGPHPQVDAERGSGDALWQITLVAHAMSRISDNTVAHLPSLLEKCLAWFRELFDGDEHQLRMIEALAEVWTTSPQMLLLALNAVMRMHMVLPVNLVTWLVRKENARRYSTDPFYWDLFSDAVNRSIESVANYVEIIDRAIGQNAHLNRSGEVTREEQARHFAGADTLEHGVVAVENAQDVGIELFEGLMKVLNEGLQNPAEKEREWVRAGKAFFRSLLQKYMTLEESGINTAVPGVEAIFDLEKIEEAVDMSSLVPELKSILVDARMRLEEKQAFGGDHAHGQIFSTED